MSNNNNHPLGEAPLFHVLISTGLGTGFFPWGPGTLAGAVALAIWLLLYHLVTPISLVYITFALISLTLIIGIWTDNVMEKYWGEDPRTVVIDEFFGTWIAVTSALCCSSTYETTIIAILSFALFRLIDITKPLGCRWVDKNIHGGWGCMLDDALAAFYAIVITLLIRYFNLIDLLPDYIKELF